MSNGMQTIDAVVRENNHLSVLLKKHKMVNFDDIYSFKFWWDRYMSSYYIEGRGIDSDGDYDRFRYQTFKQSLLDFLYEAMMTNDITQLY